MTLACQRDSYLKEFKTKVKSCKPAETSIISEGKKKKVKGYEVVLEDTILFPEGGGQPDDRGQINDVDVLKITRKGADAVHFVMSEIPMETEVDLKVDWTRRFDHMQQHTGQHLITALADSMFGYKTTSWCLGEKISSIELDATSMSESEMSQLESEVNKKIKANIPVTPVIYEDKNDPELEKFRCRGLPDDHTGAVRALVIEDIDATLCCGTHLSNLSHLQMIKLLSVESKGKKRTILSYVAGQRVLDYLGRSLQVEKALTTLLKVPLEQHFELTERAVKGFKNTQKVAQSLLRDLAVLEAERYKNQTEKDPVFVLHRKEGDNEFMNIIVNGINDQNVTCFLSVGDEKGAGLFLLSGKEEIVKELGPKVAEIVEGKGSFSRGNFQGKANKLSVKHRAEKLIREHLQNHIQNNEL